ncbi:MAG: alpha/beta hydrolase [Burkholderiaceae bacterium]
MKPSNVLILPGWQDSGPRHWQSLWAERHGYRRVEQHDWVRPLRGDWLTRLEETVIESDEATVLVAHSLGCQLVAAWAAHSQNTRRVKGALMVAPPDTAREDVAGLLPGWAPELGYKLPFRSVVVASQDDPFCAFGRARQFATAWGSQFIDYGDSGHINADSGLASWPEGHVLLQDLMKD